MFKDKIVVEFVDTCDCFNATTFLSAEKRQTKRFVLSPSILRASRGDLVVEMINNTFKDKLRAECPLLVVDMMCQLTRY